MTGFRPGQRVHAQAMNAAQQFPFRLYFHHQGVGARHADCVGYFSQNVLVAVQCTHLVFRPGYKTAGCRYIPNHLYEASHQNAEYRQYVLCHQNERSTATEAAFHHSEPTEASPP